MMEKKGMSGKGVWEREDAGRREKKQCSISSNLPELDQDVGEKVEAVFILFLVPLLCSSITDRISILNKSRFDR